MSQIFHPSANTLARFSIFGGLAAVAVVVVLLMELDRSAAVTRQNVVSEQPVPFSHDHHVGEVGIDCRYCHTSVEESSFAGIPPTSTCMSCHSVLFADSPMLEPVRASFRDDVPLEWNRVYDLPDFVYFDHSIHVAKGVGCTTCHGEIDEMPLTWRASDLTMQWCVDCHRDPAANVRPRDEVFNVDWNPASLTRDERERLVEQYGITSKTSCSTCHR